MMIHNVELSVSLTMNVDAVMSEILLLIEIPETLVMTGTVMFETLIIIVISEPPETLVAEDTIVVETYVAVVDLQMAEILMKI
jgi:hypothetical protein